MNVFRRCLFFTIFLSVLSYSLPSTAYFSLPATNQVFTMTNAVEGNEILIFKHKKHQGLIQVKSVSANGVGTGSGLGNQGGLVVSEKFPLLFVVNAGSDTISMFKIGNNDLHLLDTISSQGVRPVSIAVNKNRVYVLNAGSDSIAGFKVNYHGKLVPIAESVRTLSGTGTAAAQISFSPRGDFLIVTEKATNNIVTFVLDEDNLPGEANVNASAGVTPFGFAFDRFGHVLVSEAAGGAEDASSLSSYDIESDGTLTVLDGAVPTTETAACWVVTSRSGRVAFTTNTGSSSISAFKVNRKGKLRLANDDGMAADTGEGTAPIDMITSQDGRFLYVLSARSGSISTFRIIGNKHLFPLPGVAGLPTTLNGLASF